MNPKRPNPEAELVVPQNVWHFVLQLAHEIPLVRHLAIDKIVVMEEVVGAAHILSYL